MGGKAPWLVLFLVAVAAIGCESDAPVNPARPTPPNPQEIPAPPPATRILKLTGKSGEPVIDFGNVLVGYDGYKEFLICNTGTAEMTLEAISGPDGFAAYWDFYYYYYSPVVVRPGQCLAAYAIFTPGRIGRYEGSLVVKANHTAGTDTIPVQGTGAVPPGGPLRVFGEGLYPVGVVVEPGRYYADPNNHCSLWRLSRYPARDEADFIAGTETWFDPRHWIVDILPSDAAFQSGPGCGWWGWVPGDAPAAGTIPHGVWEVNRQIQPGQYAAHSQPGCRWERLRHFQWTPDGVREKQETTTAGTVAVTILRSDAGFLTSPECGVWTRIQ
jgi:HYDIN/CFA65/VesB family protein